MTDHDVEAVFVVYYGPAAHRAAYGRGIPGSSRYTKDFLQLSQTPELREALLRMFPPDSEGTNSTAITYRWHGGSAAGSVVFESADRPHFAWLTSDGPPAVWKMAPHPGPAGPQTIPGDPSKVTEAEADDQYEAFRATGMEAYLVVVKLADDPMALHLRVYIKAPTPDLAFADVEQLPSPIRDLALSTKRTRAFAWLPLRNEGERLSSEVAELIAKLEENPNVLLVGPPGTGKTVLLDKLAHYIENPGNRVYFDPGKNHDSWSVETAAAEAGKVRTVVLHPNYSYDDLVVGLLPVPAPTGGVAVQAIAGPLLNLAHYAATTGNRAVLILDEFNRGNAASILGDTLALLDKDKRGTASIDLAYADLGISIAEEFTADGRQTLSSRLTLPPNLWIVAAMNSSDRSVAPLDAALRRRFSILDVPPDYDTLERRLDASEDIPAPGQFTDPDDSAGPSPPSDPLADWTSGHIARLAVNLLKALNRRLEAVLGQDFQLGQSNFWHVKGESAQNALDALITVWDDRIRHTLRLTFQDNDEGLAAVLLAGTPDTATTSPQTRVAWWRAADLSVGIYGQPRLVMTRLGELDPSVALTELLRQAGT